MPQRAKSREELLTAAYLNKSDIRKLFQVSAAKAAKIYDLASRLDDEQLKDWRIEDTKVRITSVCRVTGISLNGLQKQIKNAAAVPEHTANNV